MRHAFLGITRSFDDTYSRWGNLQINWCGYEDRQMDGQAQIDFTCSPTANALLMNTSVLHETKCFGSIPQPGITWSFHMFFKCKPFAHQKFDNLPANEYQAENNPFTAALLKGINQQTLPMAIFFLRCQNILRKFCLQKTAFSILQATEVLLRQLWLQCQLCVLRCKFTLLLNLQEPFSASLW